ncbi:MAG: ATP-dependent protease ATPase subunit HslU [Clostridiales bacterium]|nr:ATP-dependent protease ATPase subunit HslU [Clostridiales bacterium]
MSTQLSPKQIVNELDKYIIGQGEAKKAVAIALRNRYRRSKLSAEIREEITPKNIIMQGPTGVGKTEIARRLAKLVKAPFVKVEATKFTEVGYVGRDVESIIRDLAEASVRLVKKERFDEVHDKAERATFDRLVLALYQSYKTKHPDMADDVVRDHIIEDLKEHRLDNEIVEVEVADDAGSGPMQMLGGGMGMEINISEMLGGILPKKKKKKRLAVVDAMHIFMNEESEKLIDMDNVSAEAIRRAEQDGIVFIDEIDKITGKGSSGSGHGPDVSREGVQRDLLPIVEGSTVSTKYGPIRTDFILFIAAGAFHLSRIEDLIPELQGRFPTLVSLNSLKYEDFVKILEDTENSLLLQYSSLLKVDNINLVFEKDGIEEIARIAVLANETNENIGARRLHSIMESLLEDVSFNATGDHPVIDIKVDKKYVDEHLVNISKKFDLGKYIL